jgi:Na+/phosphate symporter
MPPIASNPSVSSDQINTRLNNLEHKVDKLNKKIKKYVKQEEDECVIM